MKRIISFIMAMFMLSGILFLASCDFSIDELSNFSFDDIFSTKTSVSDFIDKYDEKAYSKFININKKGSVLGRGYDIINSDYFNVDGIKRGKIIDENKLGNLSFEMIESGNSLYYSAYAETIHELNEKFNGSLGIGASYGMFSGGFAASQTTNGWTKNANAFGVMDYIVNAFRINMHNTYDEIRECLTEEFMKDLTNENLKPQDLFDKYGTHMIKSAIMGGRIESIYEFSSNDSKLSNSNSLKLEAGFKKLTFSADGSLEADFNSTLYDSNVSEKFSAHCFAGTKNLINVSSYSQISANLEKWVKNFSEDISASTFCGVSSINDSLIPLWELLPDDNKYASRKQALIKAYDSSLTKSRTDMKHYDENIEYNVKWYDYNGNELSGSKYFNTYKIGQKITNFPDPPKREGYIFIGWYKNGNSNLDSLRMEIDGNREDLSLYAEYQKSEIVYSCEGSSYTETANGQHDKTYNSGAAYISIEENGDSLFLLLQEMRKYGYKYKLQIEIESADKNGLKLYDKSVAHLHHTDFYANLYTYFEIAVGNNKNKIRVLETSPKMGCVSQKAPAYSSGNKNWSYVELGRYKTSSYDLSTFTFNDDQTIRLYWYRGCDMHIGNDGICEMKWAPFTVKYIFTSY